MNAVVRIRRSTVIEAPVDAVWRLLRDFNSHESWHPAIAASRIEGGEPPDAVGSVRAFRLADGAMLREQLIALSDRDRELTYCLLEGPLPLVDYVASMRLRPVTEGDGTLIVWESRFRPPAEEADRLTRLVAEEIYEAGFAALKQTFAMHPPRPAALRPPRPVPGAVAVVEPRAAAALSPSGDIESRAIVVEAHGGAEVMRPAMVRVPPPGAGEVRLRQTAIGVNFIDIYSRTGFLRLLRPPGIPGMEAAAVVVDIGPGVTNLRAGDRVAYACEPVGAYAAFRTMNAALLVPLPADIDDETAAAVFLKALAVEFLIHEVHPLKAGDTILVHAAAGGMGLLFCRWASALGVRIIGTVSTDEKAARAREAGAGHVIVHRREDFVEAVMRLTGGRGVDVVYDGIGAATFGRSLEALAIRGHLVSFGQASGPVGAWDIGAMASKSVTVSRPNFGHYTTGPEELRARAERVFDALRRGIIAPDIDRRLPLDQAADAHRRLESGENIGALILKP
jgi:NADPH:quinone reductase-like Zn-dependent oxidoreductase